MDRFVESPIRFGFATGPRYGSGIPWTVIATVLLASGSAAHCGELQFPAEGRDWQRVEPRGAGYDPQRLQEVVAYAKSQKSSALIVLHGGRILVEAHWPRVAESGNAPARYRRMVVGSTAKGHVVEDVASVQKSVISFLVGVAAGEGKLDIDRTVTSYSNGGWSKATPEQERSITVRHLLSMTSGLDDALRFDADAGTKWKYNTGAYSQVARVLETVLEQPIAEITKTRLTDAIGMDDSRWVERPWAANFTAAAKIGLAVSARDLARFGLLIQAGGTWNGRDLLRSPGYLDAALSPSQELNRSYGLLWWLNGNATSKASRGANRMIGWRVASAPDDLVAAQGALGRKLFIVPSRNLIVVRLGDTPERAFSQELWKRLHDASESSAPAVR